MPPVPAPRLLGVGALIAFAALCRPAAALPTLLVTASSPAAPPRRNDVLALLEADAARQPFALRTFAGLDAAIAAAAPGDALLVLADGASAGASSVSGAQWAALARLGLAGAYVEMPTTLPGDAATVFAPSQAWYFDRVTARTGAIAGLAPLDILVAQGAFFMAYPVDALVNVSDLVYAHVAGSTRAVFGLPPPATLNPVLFGVALGGAAAPATATPVLVGSIALSCLVTCRYSPSQRWRAVWQHIIGNITGTNYGSFPQWQARVAPSLPSPAAALAAAGGAFGALHEVAAGPAVAAAARATDWMLTGSSLLRWGDLDACPAPHTPAGADVACMLEGFSSEMSSDGAQGLAADARMDCSAETAMALALRAGAEAAPGGGGDAADFAFAAAALLNFTFLFSDAAQGHDNSSDPSFGLIAWGVSSSSWSVCTYGDDNARVLVAALAASAALAALPNRTAPDTSAWDRMALKSVLGNLRIASVHGFRPGRINYPDLTSWQELHNSRMVYDNTSYPQPHYQAQMWAVFLLTYALTCPPGGGSGCWAPLLERARSGIEDSMAHYLGSRIPLSDVPLPPCTFSAKVPNTYLAGGCDAADCERFADVADAQRACLADATCGGITSQPSHSAPFELRASSVPSPSGSGEDSMFIVNAAACRPPAPPRFEWTEYLSEEQGRLLLPLAWLLRAEALASPVSPPNSTHLGWLQRVAGDYLATQHASGAVLETLGAAGQCDACPPASNDDYGNGEAPIIATTGEPFADLLYGNNFALTSLVEAYRATLDEARFGAPAARLAAFLIAAQVSASGDLAALDGSWMRGLDAEAWDFGGAAADVGWGPWSVETGWSATWITSGLYSLAANSSLWDIVTAPREGGVNAALLAELCPLFFDAGSDVACPGRRR